MEITTSKRRMRNLSRTLTDKNTENRILSQHLQISDNKSPNTLLVGSHGLNHSVIEPNIIKRNSSFVIFDAGGYLLEDMSSILKSQGYQIRVLNLENSYNYNQYNPFQYIRKESDIAPLVQCIMDNTQELIDSKREHSNDEFIKECEKLFLKMLLCYSWKEELNMDQIINLVRKEIIAAEHNVVSRFQKHIEKLEEIHGNEYIVVKRYHQFIHCCPMAVQQEVMRNIFYRLEVFDITSVSSSYDTINLSEITKKEKQAIFCITSTVDISLHFVAAMFYTQVCQELLYQADLHDGKLPFPVTVMFQGDEFLLKSEFWPNYFGQSYRNNINNFIHIHSLAHLKHTFGNKWSDNWKRILAACDSIVFHEYSLEADEWYMFGLDELTEKVNWSNECLVYIRKHGLFVDNKFDIKKLKYKEIRK